MKTREALTRTRALIDDRSKWCQHASRQGPHRRCAFQALVDTLGEPVTATDAYRALTKTAGMGVGDFNDTHSHDEVMHLFDQAIAAA